MEKLILVTTPGLSGGRRFAINLAAECNAKILYLLPGYNILNDEENKLVNKRKNKIYDYFIAFCKLYIYLNSNKPKYIVCEGLIPALFFAIMKNFLRYNPFFITRIGRHWNDHKYKFAWQFIYYHSERVITPLRANLDNEELAKFKNKIFFCINPVRTNNSAGLKCVTNAGNLLIIGRAVKEKNIIQSIEFAHSLAKQLNVGIDVLCSGSGNYYKLINDIGQKYGISILPFIENIESYYRKAGALINFAAGEGFSYITYESAQYGVPTISIKGISGQNEMIQRYNYGIVLERVEDINIAYDYLKNLKYKKISIDSNCCVTYFGCC
jgi:hypothetical protein